MKDNMVDCLQLARSNICPRRVFQTCVSEARKKKKSNGLEKVYLLVFRPRKVRKMAKNAKTAKHAI